MADHVNMFLLVTVLVLATILLVFGMKYFSAAKQARSRIASDERYRDLAAKATAAQTEAAALLTSMRSELSEIKTRLASVESVLKEVG